MSRLCVSWFVVICLHTMVAERGLCASQADAETIGVSKKGQVFFVALPLLVAAASFATLEPSELLSP